MIKSEAVRKAASDFIIYKDGVSAFIALRDEAKKNGIQDLPLNEINEEIRKA